MRALSGRPPCPGLLYLFGAAGSRVGGSLEKSSIAVDGPLVWGCGECSGGVRLLVRVVVSLTGLWGALDLGGRLLDVGILYLGF